MVVAARGAAAVLAVLACAGCVGQQAPSSSSPRVTPTRTVSAGVVPSGVLEQYDDGSVGLPVPAATLVLDDAARAAAVERGTQVMRLFARRTVSAPVWHTDLAPLLTARAGEVYRHVDPLNVPPTRVTGVGVLTPSSTALVARVAVPTDAGVYLVILARSDQAPAWLADRIMPPEGSGDS